MSLFLKSLDYKIVDVLPSNDSTICVVVQDEKGGKWFVKHYIADYDRNLWELFHMREVEDLKITLRAKPVQGKAIPYISTTYFESGSLRYGGTFNYGPEIVRAYKLIAGAGIIYLDCKIGNMILHNGKLFIIDWDAYYIESKTSMISWVKSREERLVCMLFQFLAIQLFAMSGNRSEIDVVAMIYIWCEINKYKEVLTGVWDTMTLPQMIINGYLIQKKWDHGSHISPSRLKLLTLKGSPKTFEVYFESVKTVIRDPVKYEDPRGIIIISDYTLPIKKVERITY